MTHITLSTSNNFTVNNRGTVILNGMQGIEL